MSRRVRKRESQAERPARAGSVPARRPLYAAGAGCLVLVVSALLLEAGMRAFGIEPQRHRRPMIQVVEGGIPVDPSRPGDRFVKVASRLEKQGVAMGEYVPGTVFRTIYDSNPRGYFDPDNGVANSINSLGLRGPEIAEAKTTGTFRILGLGDSFTYGPGVRDEDTFLRRIETSLNRNTSGTRYQVLNAGVEGYNTRDEVTTLEHRWLALQPDFVLLVFYLNDAYSDVTFLNQGEIQGVNLGRAPGLAQYSRLWDYVQHGYCRWRESEKIKAFYMSRYFAHPGEFLERPGQTDVDWSASRKALVRLRELSEERGFRAAVAVFPELHRLDEGYPFSAIHRHVAGACEAIGLPVLDLLPAFRGLTDSDLWVHPADHHPNEVAHGIAAGAIERFLREERLVDAR